MADGTITIATSIDISDLQKQLDQIKGELGKVEKSTGSAFAKMRDAMQGPIAMGKEVIRIIGEIGSATVGNAAKIEDMEAAFTPLTGSAENAKAMIAALNKEAATTPFELEGIGKVAKQLLPVLGNDVQAVTETFRMLGDTAGGNIEKLDSITRGYMKTMLKSKVDMESLNMIAEAGVPIYKSLADSMGVSVAQMMDMSSKGQITSDMLTKAFQDMTSEGGIFFNGMEVASQTLNGKLSTMNDNFTQIGAAIGKELLPSTKGLVDNINEASGAFLKWANENDNLGKTMGVVGDIIKGIIKFNTPFIDLAIQAGKYWSENGEVIMQSFALMGKEAQKLGAGVESALVVGFASAKKAAAEFGVLIIDKVLGALTALLKSLSGIPGVGKYFEQMTGNVDGLKNSLIASAKEAQNESAAAIGAARNKQAFIESATNKEIANLKTLNSVKNDNAKNAGMIAATEEMYSQRSVAATGEVAKAEAARATESEKHARKKEKEKETELVGIENIRKAYENLYTSLNSETDSFLTKVKSMNDNTTTAIKGVNDTLDLMTFAAPIDEAKKLYDGIIELSEGIGTVVKNGPEIAKQMTENLLDAIASIIENLPALINQGVKMISEIVVKIIEDLPEILTSLVESFFLIGPALTVAIIKALPDIIKALFMLPYELAKSLPELVVETGKAFFQLGKELALFIWNGLKIAWDIIKWIVDLLPKPSDFKSFNIADVGNFIVQSIVDGINFFGDMFAAVRDFFQRLFDGMRAFFVGMFDIGSQIVQGIVNGILGAPSLWDSVVSFFQNFIDKFKAFFLISSPSKLFADFGGFLVQGIVDGINGASAIFDQVKGVFEGFLSSISDLFGKGAELGSNLVNGIAGGVQSAAAAASSAAAGATEQVVNAATSAAKSTGKATKSAVSKAVDTAKKVGKGVKKLLGFSEGGYTGDGPANEIAGVVHRGEYVLTRDETKAMMASGAGLQSVIDGMRSGLPSVQTPLTGQSASITLNNQMSGNIIVDGRTLAQIVMENIDRVAGSAYGLNRGLA